MNDFFKRLFDQAKALWAKWTLVQKLILAGVMLAAIIAVVVLVRVSAAPTMVKLLGTPIKTEEELRLITSKLDTEGIPYTVGESNQLYVKDQKTALRAKGILIRDDLIPKGTDPWAIFDVQSWTITDFERNVNLRRAIIGQVTQQIEALDDVDKASVTVVMPEKELFQADQKPVTASVIIFPKPGSDLVQNRKKVEGIQKILKFAVEGLADENIVITDQNGIVLNDFVNLADFDRLQQTKSEQKLIQDLEGQYRAKVLKALQQIYTADRVRDLNIKIDMDMSKKNVKTEEFFPVTIKPRTPRSPYDDSDVRASVTRSKTETTTEWTGHGLQSRGPRRDRGADRPRLQGPAEHAGQDDPALHRAERGDQQAQHRRGELAHDPAGDGLGQHRRRLAVEVRRQGPPQDAAPGRRRSRVRADPGRRRQEGAVPHPGRDRLQPGPRRLGDRAEHRLRPERASSRPRTRTTCATSRSSRSSSTRSSGSPYS